MSAHRGVSLALTILLCSTACPLAAGEAVLVAVQVPNAGPYAWIGDQVKAGLDATVSLQKQKECQVTGMYNWISRPLEQAGTRRKI